MYDCPLPSTHTTSRFVRARVDSCSVTCVYLYNKGAIYAAISGECQYLLYVRILSSLLFTQHFFSLYSICIRVRVVLVYVCFFLTVHIQQPIHSLTYYLHHALLSATYVAVFVSVSACNASTALFFLYTYRCSVVPLSIGFSFSVSDVKGKKTTRERQKVIIDTL